MTRKRKRGFTLIMTIVFLLQLLGTTRAIGVPAAVADEIPYADQYDGSQLWLRYAPVSDAALLESYKQSITGIVVENHDAAKVFKATDNLSMYPGSQESLLETTLGAARAELICGLSGLLQVDGESLITEAVTQNGALVVGTPSSSPLIAELNLDLSEAGSEGYVIKTVTIGGYDATVIAANTDIGALYGTYTFLRLVQTQKAIANLNIADKPKFNNRQLNNWEMGSANGQFLKWTGDNALPQILDSYIIFARTAASIGVNELSVNMINANDAFLGEERIAQIAALADALRPYGVRVLIAINYTAPTSKNEALDQNMKVETNDPFSEDFQNWWTYKTIQITEKIPDFVGYTVKANSEGMPGPQEFGYTHGDGANGIAKAISYKGDFSFKGFEREGVNLDVKVFWRTFVYEAKVDPDRLKRPYIEFGKVNDELLKGAYLRNEAGNFVDEDGNDIGETGIVDDVDLRYRPVIYDEDGEPRQGGFLPNAYIQTKNGSLDYQPIEPIHPLFGLMDNTTQMLEVEVYQEYTGGTTFPCFLGTMWERVLKWQTNAVAYKKDAKGNYVLDENGERIIEKKDALVGEILDGTFQGQPDSGMVGVCNLDGMPTLTTSQQMSQANWFTFGRQSWDWTLSAEGIAEDWVRMTWGNDPAVVEAIKGFMLESLPAVIAYENPLGIHHQFNLDTHYTPMPWEDRTQDDWDAVYYAKADSVGVGYNRTSEGTNFSVPPSGYVNQYFEPLRSTLANIDTTPEELLPWFHHVPWDYTLKSRRIYWDELVYRYQAGVQAVTWMKDTWASLSNYFKENNDIKRYYDVYETLIQSELDAARWRDVMVWYFGQFSERPIPVDDGALSIAVTVAGKEYRGFNLSADDFSYSSVFASAGGQNGVAGSPGFETPKYYTISIPFGAEPVITDVNPLNGASYDIIQQAAGITGEAIVRVTGYDANVGSLVKYYRFHFEYDTSLSSIMVDGLPLEGFKPEQNVYNLLTSSGTVTASASDPNANVIVDGSIITVTNAGNKTVYTLNFSEPVSVLDEFTEDTLNAAWSVKEPFAPDEISLTDVPGALTINGKMGSLKGAANNAKNIILRDIGGYAWEAETKVFFNKQLNTDNEQAGIIAYLDDDNYVKVAWENLDTGWWINTRNRRAVMTWEIGGQNTTTVATIGSDVTVDAQSFFTLTSMANMIGPNDPVWLKLVKEGNKFTGYFSFDGTTWRWMGQHTARWEINLEPDKIGLFAFTEGGDTTDMFASFDYFKVESVAK